MLNARTSLVVCGALLVVAIARAEAPAGAVDHSKMDHAAMGHGGPPPADGPWSYKSRKNPAPHKHGRWDMVPVPGYGHMFINVGKLSPELRCAALRDNPGVMVDRATRKACGVSEAAAPAARPAMPEAVDHKAMGH